ncbi:MAG: zinc-dependent peptidase, partial [Vicinamibacterales bacterium]|nr:zinc-dependent peptidase [Vicinamibacterales bacterium]
MNATYRSAPAPPASLTTPVAHADEARPFVAWERRTRFWALVFAVVTLGVTLLGAVVLIRAGRPAGTTVVLALMPACGVYVWQTARVRRRRALLRAPFPPEWETVLQRDVLFFRTLDPSHQLRFRRELQVFLGEKRITGVKVRLDTTTQVLAGVSAIIPIFGFPDWEWDQIREILVYPTRFDGEFDFGDRRDHNILGMVGTGIMNGLMILSKPDLIQGFRNATDKRNVGVHE